MKIFLSILFFPSFLFAQNRVGNGGHVVKCAKSATTLDLYESNESLAKNEDKDEWSYAKKIFKSLSKSSPELEEQYLKRLAEVQGQWDTKSDIELTLIEDHNSVLKKKHKDCKVVQAVIRKGAVSSISKQFSVDSDLWKELSTQNRAALITHEIIYEHFFKLGEIDSQKARELNRWLYEERFTQVTPEDFWKFIKSLKVPIYRR